MRLSIHTIEKTLFDDEIKSITVMTEEGEITVLKNHVPLVTRVKPGIVTVIDKKGELHRIDFSLSGFLEIRPEDQGVVLLAE